MTRVSVSGLLIEQLIAVITIASLNKQVCSPSSLTARSILHAIPLFSLSEKAKNLYRDESSAACLTRLLCVLFTPLCRLFNCDKQTQQRKPHFNGRHISTANAGPKWDFKPGVKYPLLPPPAVMTWTKKPNSSQIPILCASKPWKGTKRRPVEQI